MARTRGDHDARRRDVSEAVWAVLAAHGFTGLSMRAVAHQLGATTGVLTHYFTSKRALTGYALDLLEQRNAERVRRSAAPGLDALRAALLDMLPLDAASTAANRIWVASWDAALAEPEHTAQHAARYARSRDKLVGLVVEAQSNGDLRPADPVLTAARLQAFALGLIVQAVLDPGAFPPSKQTQLLDDVLSDLRPASPTPGA